ncbi:MAG: hypothetical protein KF880_02790 [Ferruginibacter sp.]|nr:hypothetical protein [Ferruginibacter sp.]
MSVHTVVNKEGIYFITFTCYKWLPLIEASGGYDIVYNFFQVMTRKGHTLLAYVIMPNHLHFIMHYKSDGETLNTVIGNGKRFMAYEMIKRLQEKGNRNLIRKLQQAVGKADRIRGKKHEVWISGFDVKQCRTEKFVLQKLIYLHENPVRGAWKLAKSSLDYLHSSAMYYFSGKQRLFEVRDYRDFIAPETTGE